ncbi:hypothetical protein NE237_025583 [Protea cynaroides]|uniref:Uncharacterized protein n=1 Tax=Protea cynaroides TaxID=273540 RepID=A0A9Q0K0N9_9MAGN|nr:hypothetical protein NE237_025583 [Protea cynaroides]
MGFMECNDPEAMETDPTGRYICLNDVIGKGNFILHAIFLQASSFFFYSFGLQNDQRPITRTPDDAVAIVCTLNISSFIEGLYHFSLHTPALPACHFGVVLDNQMRLPILNGENYAEWLELLELTLGCMNLDLVINEEKPEDLTDESTPDQRDYYAKWQRSNNMSLRLIKVNMSRTIRRSIPDKPTAREYLDAIKKQYVSTDSSTVSTLIAKLGAI